MKTARGRVELQNVKGRFPSPDFTDHYRLAKKWGYVQVGGAVRYIAYDDTSKDGAIAPSSRAPCRWPSSGSGRGIHASS